jgi:septal ring factor EnvC (AmiA/AmiB activator)
MTKLFVVTHAHANPDGDVAHAWWFEEADSCAAVLEIAAKSPLIREGGEVAVGAISDEAIRRTARHLGMVDQDQHEKAIAIEREETRKKRDAFLCVNDQLTSCQKALGAREEEVKTLSTSLRDAGRDLINKDATIQKLNKKLQLLQKRVDLPARKRSRRGRR